MKRLRKRYCTFKFYFEKNNLLQYITASIHQYIIANYGFDPEEINKNRRYKNICN